MRPYADLDLTSKLPIVDVFPVLWADKFYFLRKSAIYNSIKLHFDAEVNEKFLNVIKYSIHEITSILLHSVQLKFILTVRFFVI